MTLHQTMSEMRSHDFKSDWNEAVCKKSELQWAEQMLLALKPLWWEEWEDHRALMSALLKTQALLRSDE